MPFLISDLVICFSHIGKPGTDPVIILSDKRIWQKVYMIGDNHYITNLEIRIDSACSI